MNYRELAEKVRYFKEDEKEIDTMCKVMEDMRNETAKRAAEQKKFNIAQSLIKMGYLFRTKHLGTDTLLSRSRHKRVCTHVRLPILNSYKMGKLSMEEIAASVQLSLEKVQELALQIA